MYCLTTKKKLQFIFYMNNNLYQYFVFVPIITNLQTMITKTLSHTTKK